MNEDKIFDLVTKIKKENVESIALLGSYARGEAKTYSDIDLVLFVNYKIKDYDIQYDLINGKYLVINYISFRIKSKRKRVMGTN